MKKINECKDSARLVVILFVGIVMCLLAYRIFSFLCEAGAFQWWFILLGAVCAALAVTGFLLAYRAWRRLQYLRDHPNE